MVTGYARDLAGKRRWKLPEAERFSNPQAAPADLGSA